MTMISQQTRVLWRDLRQELAPLTFLPYIIVGLTLIYSDANSAEPSSWTTVGILAMVAGLASVLSPIGQRLALAKGMHGAIVGLVLLAWSWFPGSHVQYAILAPLLSVGMLGGIGLPFLMAICVTVFTAWSVLLGPLSPYIDGAYMVAFWSVQWACVFLIWVSQKPIETMMEWSWQGYEQARVLLDDARDRQLELNQALDDLALANAQTVRLNQMLTAAQTQVEDARNAKEEFVANVSHELRTPLNMIIGFSDMILESPQVYDRRLPHALLADVSAIKRNSQHLADLVDDVLDLSEADAGYTQLIKEWCSIPGLVKEAVEAISALFDSKNLTLQAEVADDIPDVYCDRTRIRQVLLNLLSNAGRFTDAGGARVCARMDDPDTILVRVSDSGPGIEPDKLDRMFQPFSQADATIRRQHGGSGLGLAISKRFVEMHGGSIGIESAFDHGTTVTFRLPVRQTPHVASAARWFGPYDTYSGRTRQSRAPEIDARPSVVVYEDGDTLSGLIARHIEDLVPLHADRLEEALSLVEEQAALALVINRPSGARSLRRGQRAQLMRFDVPVISCWIPERSAITKHLGAEAYLTKPIRRTALADALDRVSPGARSVLLVDDDPEARQLIGRILVSDGEGVRVSQAVDGESALTMMRELRPDAVLLDLRMPNVDGYAALEAKATDPEIADIPVIIISAQDPPRGRVVSRSLAVSRQGGLTQRDVLEAVRALTEALKPRFGARALRETPPVS